MNIHDEALTQILNENNISYEWPDSVKKELKKLSDTKNIRRQDLTSNPFITIDGNDAKDFDDAIYCYKKDGEIFLNVAIADVANIVKTESQIDIEARKRGTSIYFPAKVIPMLPEEISNNICSLIPNEVRNVLVCRINFSLKGAIKGYEFFEASIKSNLRATYDSIDEALKNNNLLPKEIQKSIVELKKLTKLLLLKRSQRYALELDATEPILELNKSGEIKKIRTSQRLFSHLMIEEAM